MSTSLLRCCNTAEGDRTPRYKARLAAAFAVLLLAPGLAGCGGSSTSGYCDAVKAHQGQLSKVLAGGGEAALLDALPIFRTLRTQSPGDIRGDWSTLVDRLGALQSALEHAGVDPATYDATHPPASVSAAQRTAIARAATVLGATSTLTALDAVQQQARDVCHTALSL